MKHQPWPKPPADTERFRYLLESRWPEIERRVGHTVKLGHVGCWGRDVFVKVDPLAAGDPIQLSFEAVEAYRGSATESEGEAAATEICEALVREIQERCRP